jgi:K+-sensing histidine kinase KdpD
MRPMQPYVVTALCVLLTLVIKVALDGFVPQAPLTITFFCPVIIAAWYGGMRQGLFAILLSLPIYFYCFLPQDGSISSASPRDGVRLALFILEGLLASALLGSLHRAREQVQTRAVELQLQQEMLVNDRTYELAEVNRALQLEIAERKGVQETLSREREFLMTVLQNINDGVVACDANEVLTFFNRAAEHFHGSPIASIPVEDRARHYGLYRADGGALLGGDETPLHRAWLGEVVHDAELVIISGSGEPRSILANGQPLLNAQG